VPLRRVATSPDAGPGSGRGTGKGGLPGLSSGGGGNRKHPISRRIRQLRVIAGNRIRSQRKRNTAKSMFGKRLCQLAKSNARPRREGRTWETRPPPRPWACWRARFCRALGTRSREIWRAPSCGYWRAPRSNRDGRFGVLMHCMNALTSVGCST
jgi:hypothetical protein